MFYPTLARGYRNSTLVSLILVARHSTIQVCPRLHLIVPVHHRLTLPLFEQFWITILILSVSRSILARRSKLDTPPSC